MPDIANAGCLILWGYNPSLLAADPCHGDGRGAEARHEADRRRSAPCRPRQQGRRLAARAPGTDGALALGLANLMIAARLVRSRRSSATGPTGRCWCAPIPAACCARATSRPTGDAHRLCGLGWRRPARPVAYDPATGDTTATQEPGAARRVPIATSQRHGRLPASVRPLRRAVPRTIRRRVEAPCWIRATELERQRGLSGTPAGRLLRLERPRAARQHDRDRARHALLYALTGSFDAPGGNVLLPAVPTAPITGEDLPAAKTMAPTIGLAERPLGPAR